MCIPSYQNTRHVEVGVCLRLACRRNCWKVNCDDTFNSKCLKSFSQLSSFEQNAGGKLECECLRLEGRCSPRRNISTEFFLVFILVSSKNKISNEDSLTFFLPARFLAFCRSSSVLRTELICCQLSLQNIKY